MANRHQDGYKEGDLMKYWEVLSSVGAKTSAPTVDEMKQEFKNAIDDAVDRLRESTPVAQPMPSAEQLGTMIDQAVKNAAKDIIPTQVTAKPDMELNDKVNQMMQIMKELAERNNSAPANFESYALKDDEISQVLTWLLNFQEKYFPNTPLSETLHQDFMWNIPKEVYDAAAAAEIYGYPDALNPIYWFYLFCTDCPHDMIGEFIMTAIDSISDEDSEVISKHAKEYRRAYFDEPEPVVSPVNPAGTSTIEDFDSDVDVEVINNTSEE